MTLRPPTRRQIMAALTSSTVLLFGCATPRGQHSGAGHGSSAWFGRISIRTLTDPPQQFSASFELRGNAETGQLTLISPIGTTLAQARWTPAGAELEQGNSHQTFSNMNALTTALHGSPLPVTAMFSWLQGQPLAADGWSVQLDQASTGRIQATRTTPEPATDIRIILDKPDDD